MMRFEPRAVQAITCVSTWRLSVPKRSAHENEPSVLHALADGRDAHRVLAMARRRWEGVNPLPTPLCLKQSGISDGLPTAPRAAADRYWTTTYRVWTGTK